MSSLGETTVVLGVGNIIHQDDGAGVHALRLLEMDPRLPRETVLVDGGTRGLELLADLHNCARLLLLDAVDVGKSPGTVVRMSGDELAGFTGGASVHQLGLADLLATVRFVFDRPMEIVLLGVQPQSTYWSIDLTGPVQTALPQLVELAIEQLLLWSNAANNAVTLPAGS